MNQHSLPLQRDLPINALSKVFQKTTNSYKYFFFLALLDCLERNFKKEEHAKSTVISGHDLLKTYLLKAWYPAVFFRLNLGSNDQLQDWSEKIRIQNDDLIRSRPISTMRKISNHMRFDKNAEEIDKIFQYVPTRLIRPFFHPSDLAGIPDSEVDRRIRYLAAKKFTQKNPPPYRWKSDPEIETRNDRHDLVMHPAWQEYLLKHLEVLRGWAYFHLATYLQARNPTSPSIVTKLFAPFERAPLKKQQKFWRETIAGQSGGTIRCPYSENTLYPSRFALDHYLPWSFVGHDEGWNLVPVHPDANSSKRDHLPEATTVRLLVKVHAMAFKTIKSPSNPNQPEIVQQMADFLEVPPQDLPQLTEDYIGRIYVRKFRPIVGLAVNSGFPCDWRFGKWTLRDSYGSSWDHFEW
jgi:hypothetical protein